MLLSKRLYMVASRVSKGHRAVDVGCDHAYISIFLIRHSISPSAIATDVNAGPLERAAGNIKLYGCEDFIETRLSDGLEQVKPGEADVIIIAGMGGGLIVRILENSAECVEKAEELVLQPQSEPGAVRHLLHRIGYKIVDEAMCIEDGKFYTCIRAVHNAPGEKESYACEEYYEYGKLLIEEQNEILKEYLLEEHRKALIVKENLESNDTQNTRERLPGFLFELSVMENAMQILHI